MKSARTLQRCV
uniref:Uncharacterized protein n=1 Tax=Anguilla anguilla TaxID=7936 RepID=A0A0E9X9M0_ANGAN